MLENITAVFKNTVKNRGEQDSKRLLTDGGKPTDRTHVNRENGLWIPPQFRDEGQVIIRTPRATIQHHGDLGSYYGMIDESHFGSPDEFRDAKNEHLAPDQVSIKNAGEDAETFNVEIHPDVIADGGITIESEFLPRATQLEDVSVSTEDDRFVVTVRGPADGVIDASPVIDLATECGHSIGPVLADIEKPEVTVEVKR